MASTIQPTNPNAVPLTAMKYHSYVDAAAYVITGIAGYSAFATDHPVASVYLYSLAAGLFAFANWLTAKGD